MDHEAFIVGFIIGIPIAQLFILLFHPVLDRIAIWNIECKYDFSRHDDDEPLPREYWDLDLNRVTARTICPEHPKHDA